MHPTNPLYVNIFGCFSNSYKTKMYHLRSTTYCIIVIFVLDVIVS